MLCTAVAEVFRSQTKARIMVGDPHQQIYGFRGAINAMEMVSSTRTFFLTQVDCNPSRTLTGGCIGCSVIYYFASAAVTVDSSHITASSSAPWSRFSSPSNFVNGHVPTMWFTVCRWPQSQEGDWARPHFCTLARHGP